MIIIRQYENKWRTEISHEIWEFENLSELLSELKPLLELKEKHGKIKEGRGQCQYS